MDAARNGFEQAANVHKGTETGDLAILLLGNLLLQSGDQAAAFKPLNDARRVCDGLFAGYAGYLERHVLIGQDEEDQAGEVLEYAQWEAHPARGGSKRLYPWVAVRFGELLAAHAHSLDL